MLPSLTLLEGRGDRSTSGTLGSTDTGLGSSWVKGQDLPVCLLLPEHLPMSVTCVYLSLPPSQPHKEPLPTPCIVREMATTQNQS